MAEKKDRLTELLSDEGFMKKLFSQDTPEKAQEILKENGVDMPVEEVFIMGKTVLYMGEHDGELPDEFAEQVAGGALDLNALAQSLGALPYAVQGFVSMIAGFGAFLKGWNDPKGIGQKALDSYYKQPDFLTGGGTQGGGTQGGDTQDGDTQDAD